MQTAVHTHSKDSDVLDQGLGALWSLAADAQNKVLIVKAGGIAVLLQAMQTAAQDASSEMRFGFEKIAGIHEKVLGIL